MTIAKAFIYFTAIVFFGYGVLFLVKPGEQFYWLTHQVIIENNAFIDLRATYGGFSIAIGISLFYLARQNALIKLALAWIVILMIAMGGSRTMGMIIDGEANNLMIAYLASEIFAAIFAFWLLKRLDNK
ncbi:DUF4345 domain-containing protein [Thalassotalea agarivorans]|uniref:DUF4345 domain-containing protein n=1 Tax=Thalassotalea agarivorans TaxID=349064 RepID=A0A1I0HVA9_THASX|nr:DUF4345 domain-containing protein [Thalassotalea agarivorans]SET88071.1 protein of unknown function [Thalassotalea agarivorans]